MNQDLKLFTSLCIIISLPCLFLGCHPKLSTWCYKYEIVNNPIIKQEIINETCEECQYYCKKSNKYYCCYFNYFECFDVYVYTNQCKIKISTEFNFNNTDKILSNYQIGHNLNLLKNKNSNNENCFRSNKILNLWIVGITFFSLFIFILLSYYTYLFLSKIYPKKIVPDKIQT